MMRAGLLAIVLTAALAAGVVGGPGEEAGRDP
jgi:hypothetical protein